jgi:hypothetical protein
MRRAFTLGSRTIVATRTSRGDTAMVECRAGEACCRLMTGLTGLRCGNMRRVLTLCHRTVVAARTTRRDACMVHRRTNKCGR